jgi:hypothetical protein
MGESPRGWVQVHGMRLEAPADDSGALNYGSGEATVHQTKAVGSELQERWGVRES